MSEKVIRAATQAIIDIMEKGEVPWKRGWNVKGPSHNVLTGHVYTGVNRLFTHPMVTGFTNSGFITRSMVRKMKLTVKEDQKKKYIPVIYYGTGKDKEKESDYRFCKFYPVYNVDQVEGLELNKTEEDRDVEKNLTAEGVVRKYSKLVGETYRPEIIYGDYSCPSYAPINDTVRMMEPKTFHSDGEYYAALFHELVHSTGHKSRLDRDMASLSRDSHSYSKEELIAELGAAFLCHHTGVQGVIENQAAYCQSWLRRLKNDRNMIFEAAREADKAFRLITGEPNVKQTR